MGRKETMGVQASLNGPVDKAAAAKTAALDSGISYKKIVKPRRAVSYTHLKSFRGAKDAQLVRFGAPQAAVEAGFYVAGREQKRCV